MKRNRFRAALLEGAIMRTTALRAAAVLLLPITVEQANRILNGAARELWPTLWPTVAAGLAKGK